MSIGRGWHEDEVKEEYHKLDDVKKLAVELLREKITICFLKYKENKEKGIDIKLPGSRRGYF